MASNRRRVKRPQVTKCAEVMSKRPGRGPDRERPQPGPPVREEFGWVAKRTDAAFIVPGRQKRHGNLWKNLMLPGVFLWKDVGPIIHTIDSRVLDDLVIRGRYSPALIFWERDRLPCRSWMTGPLSVTTRKTSRWDVHSPFHRCGCICGQLDRIWRSGP